jgi:two-component system nitrogen regulation response regulator NtrX
VIQEQTLERVGGEKTIDTDVRILAATNKDLEQECARGRFRQDLYFRLNVIPIYMPPLRDRTGDILLLLHHFLKEMGEAKPELEDEARDLLLAYGWPGNVRELKNLAERIMVMWPGGTIKAEALRELLNQRADVRSPSPEPLPGGEKNDAKKPANQGEDALQGQLSLDILGLKYTEAKELFEKNYLEFQLGQYDGVISRTAEAIGIYPSNLHAKIRKYGLKVKR